MGQKTNPIGNRLGIIRGWESNWYGGDNFGDKLAEDAKIRKYLNVRLSKGSVCLLYTDAADEEDSVDLGGRRIIKKKKKQQQTTHNNKNK